MNAVLTLRALDVALQRSTDVGWLDPRQFAPCLDWGLARVTAKSGMVLLHAEDSLEDRRIIFHDFDGPSGLGRLPKDAQRQAIQRAHRAALAATASRVRLPLDWSEYHTGNLITFFACNRSFGSFRWVAEIGPSSSEDISFWRLTGVDDRVPLAEFTTSEADYVAAIAPWRCPSHC